MLFWGNGGAGPFQIWRWFAVSVTHTHRAAFAKNCCNEHVLSSELRIVTEPAVSLKLHRSLLFNASLKNTFSDCYFMYFALWLSLWCVLLLYTGKPVWCTHYHHHPWMDMPKLNVEPEELPQCYCYAVYQPKHIIVHSMALKLTFKWWSIMSLQFFSTLGASQDWDFPMQCILFVPMQCILFVRWIILCLVALEKNLFHLLVCASVVSRQLIDPAPSVAGIFSWLISPRIIASCTL